MNLYFLLLSAFVSFLVTLIFMPKYMRFVKNIGVVAIDQQKKDKPSLPTSAGIPSLIGLMTGILLYILLTTFLGTKGDPAILSTNMNLLAAVLSILLITLVGFFDDIYVKKEATAQRSDTVERRVGLKQWMKPLFTIFGAIPLVVISAGSSGMTIPFLGFVDFGLFFPLVIIPMAVVCVANATNMLAGLNGLEAGLMIIASFTAGLFLITVGRMDAALIALALCFSLVAVLWFNKNPSKILPGDSLTYFIGGAFVAAIIFGNIEKFGLIIFFPWIIEAFLKLRKRFNARSFGNLQEDGTIKCPYNKIYSLTHVVMLLPERYLGKRVTEKQAVYLLWAFEAVICVSAFVYFVYL